MEVIRLIDRVSVRSLIENEDFENALIVGPAVIAPLERVTIADCSFDGDPTSLFIEVPENRFVLGVIGLRNVTFRKCEFRNVGIMGTALSVAQFRQGLTQAPAPIIPQG